MKIKIIEPGWAGFTGPLGWTEFVDGVSVDEVSKAEAQHLAAVVQIEELDSAGEGTGKSPSIAQVILDTHGKSAPAETTVKGTDAAPAPVAPAKVYTPEELAAVADADGIKGIRQIADPLGLKGTSIAELIGKVLTAQTEALAKVAAAPAADETQPAVAAA
jgi:hypothetical protein